jgi:ABC-2 type transport system permease protein
MCISTPSVSLEGQNLWILKSMPLSSKQILLAKLRFHILATVPVTTVCALVLAVAYGCHNLDIIFCGAVCGLLALLNGIIGMLTGLKWAKFDYISEVYPCKQSIAVIISMLSMMGLPALFGILYGTLFADSLSVTLFLGLSVLLLACIALAFYRLLVTWGTRKWDSL